MKKILLLSFLFATTMLSAQKPVELPLWPNGAPNNNELTNSGQNHNNEWVSDVTTPTLTVYPASHPNGMAIIMCPGGGYGGLAMKHEGHDMAPWFNTQGITYAVLKYRMPNGHHEVPLSDAEQAIRMVRKHAAEWGVNPQRVGIMGASAGGHLAASLATLYSSDKTRPDFQILFYPVPCRKALPMEVPARTLSEKIHLRSWNKNTPSKDKCPHALRRLLSCFLRTTTQCHPSTALAISSPCVTTKCLPACMPTLPADMAGDSGTTSPTSVNGRKNWRSGCVKGSYSRSLNLPQRNKSNYE